MKHAPSMNGKRCPMCGGYIEDGLCLECGYDEHLDGDLSIGGGPKKEKKGESLLDILLGDSKESDWPF